MLQVLAALGSCPVTLTPNRVEFERLCDALGLAERGSASFDRRAELAPRIARAVGGGAVVVAKGPGDVISDGATTVTCRAEGSPRRCGGQGDVLAGLLLAMRAWSDSAIQAHPPPPLAPRPLPARMSRPCPPAPLGHAPL